MLLISITVMLVIGQPVPSDSESDALVQALSDFGVGADPREGIAILDSFAQQVTRMDRHSIARLMDVVANQRIHTTIRKNALAIICAKADSESAGLVVDRVRILAMRAEMKPSAPGMSRSGSDSLIGSFVRNGLPELERNMEDKRIALEFYKEVALGLDLDIPKIREDAVKRIVACDASRPLRQQCAFELMQAAPASVWHRELEPLMDQRFAERIRPLIIQKAESYAPFNWTAVALLARYGDRQTAATLREWVAGRADANVAEKMVRDYVWMIDAQHHTSMLVDYIRSDSSRRTPAPRTWALRKAFGIGVPHSELKAAVQEHAQKIDNRSWMYVSIMELKDEAVKLGILDDNDLPDVLPMTASAPEISDVLRKLNKKRRGSEGGSP
jgi:hypothetical protein